MIPESYSEFLDKTTVLPVDFIGDIDRLAKRFICPALTG
jgi:hypothetical protein